MRVFRIFHGGGVPAYQQRDAELARLGHQVTLVVPRWFRELPEITVAEKRDDEITVLPVGLYGPRRNPFYFYNPLEIAKVLSDFRPDIIDIHEEPYSLAAFSALLARMLVRSKAEVVFRSSQNVYKKYPFPFSWIQRAVFRSSSAAYVPSAQAKAVLERKGYAAPVSVIGNGVDFRTPPTEPEHRNSRQLEVLYVGRLIERKGVLDLVEAAIPLGDLIHVTFVGSGPLQSQIQTMISRASSRFTTVGAVPHEEVADFMERADVICVPSHELDGWSEQFSRALVEGMASSCVPVVSTSGALPDVSGGIRTPIPWGDAEALSTELRDLATLESLEELKEAARQHALSNYSWSATSSRLSEIYEGVARV